MTQPATVLELLDFPPGCDGDNCCERARVKCTIHLVDDCDHPEAVSGDEVVLLCQPCLARVLGQAQKFLRHTRKWRRQHCRVCFSPMVILSDIVREVEPL